MTYKCAVNQCSTSVPHHYPSGRRELVVNGPIAIRRPLIIACIALTTLPINIALANDRMFDRGIQSGNCMQWERAATQFTVVLKHDPANVDAYYRRALCYVRMKDDMGAIRDLSKALSMRPDPELLLLRGSIFKRVGLSGEAIDDYSQAISHICFDTYIRADQPQAIMGEAYFRRGEVKLQIGRREEAAHDFKAALGFKPELQALVDQYQDSLGFAVPAENVAVVDLGEFLYPADTASATAAVKLSALEVQLFGRPSDNELIGNRVARLEQFIFGSANEDKVLAERIVRLVSYVQPGK